MTLGDLHRKLGIIRLNLESCLSSVRVLEAEILQLSRDAAEAAKESRQQTTDVEPTAKPEECPCPLTARVRMASMGHPNRTMCRLCKKEYE